VPFQLCVLHTRLPVYTTAKSIIQPVSCGAFCFVSYSVPQVLFLETKVCEWGHTLTRKGWPGRNTVVQQVLSLERQGRGEIEGGGGCLAWHRMQGLVCPLPHNGRTLQPAPSCAVVNVNNNTSTSIQLHHCFIHQCINMNTKFNNILLPALPSLLLDNFKVKHVQYASAPVS
jgi:hypothetical protein